jgi:hypothetical protein
MRSCRARVGWPIRIPANGLALSMSAFVNRMVIGGNGPCIGVCIVGPQSN